MKGRTSTLDPAIIKVGTRGHTENFIFGPPGPDDMLYDRPRTEQAYVPVGVVQGFGTTSEGGGWLEIEVKNPLRKGDKIEYLCRGIKTVSVEVEALLDKDNIPLEQANPGNIVKIKYGPLPEATWEVNSLLRKKK